MTSYKNDRDRDQRIQRARQKRAAGAPPPGVEHGLNCYANYGCKCDIGRKANREYKRKHRVPSPLTLEVDRLNNELDAAEMNLDALREENAMLRCRLQELGE